MVKISQDLMVASTSQARMRLHMTPAAQSAILSKQSHLSLDNKHIHRIEGLNGCPTLRVLYLFDNHIEELDGLQGVPNLTHLYLQQNKISSIGDITMLTKLSKLYLNGNCLPSLMPLAVLGSSLVELHVGSQRPPSGAPLDLAPAALREMRALRVLCISNNGLHDLTPLANLCSLEVLDASKNNVDSVAAVAPALGGCMALRELDLRDNPVSTVRQMLDAVIVSGRELQVHAIHLRGQARAHEGLRAHGTLLVVARVRLGSPDRPEPAWMLWRPPQCVLRSIFAVAQREDPHAQRAPLPRAADAPRRAAVRYGWFGSRAHGR